MGTILVWAPCQVCDRESTCVHDEGAFCGECCPYEQAVRAEREENQG